MTRDGGVGNVAELAGTTGRSQMPPDLERVVIAWPHLSDAARAGIVAMVAASAITE